MPVKEMVEDKIAEEQKSEKSEMKWHDEENISVSLYDENNRDDSNRVVEGEPVKISIEELRTSENVGQLIRTRMNIEVGIRLVLKFMHQTPLQSSHHVHGKKREWTVVPMSNTLPSGTYRVAYGPPQVRLAPIHFQPPPLMINVDEEKRPYRLKVVQEPPHGPVQWLAAHTTRDGRVNYAFDPPVELELQRTDSQQLEQTDAVAHLEKMEVVLYTAEMVVISHELLPTEPTRGQVVITHTDGRVTATYPKLGIKAIAAAYATAATSRTPHTAPRKESGSRKKTTSASGRNAAGYFHLGFRIPEVASLVVHERDDIYTHAKISTKSWRSSNDTKKSKGWKSKAIGPFADHSRCRPSHVMPSGGYYCREKKLTNGIFKFDCGCEESPCNEDSSYCPGADRGPPQMDGMPTVIAAPLEPLSRLESARSAEALEVTSSGTPVDGQPDAKRARR